MVWPHVTSKEPRRYKPSLIWISVVNLVLSFVMIMARRQHSYGAGHRMVVLPGSAMLATGISGLHYFALIPYDDLAVHDQSTVSSQSFLETDEGQDCWNRRGKLIQISPDHTTVIPAGWVPFPVCHECPKGVCGGNIACFPIVEKTFYEHLSQRAWNVIQGETTGHLNSAADKGWPPLKAAWNKCKSGLTDHEFTSN